MTIPGLPAWAAPPAPLPTPGAQRMDPPLIQSLPDGSMVVYPMAYYAGWGAGYDPAGGGMWDDAQQIVAALQQSGGPSGGWTNQTNAGATITGASGGLVRLGPWPYNILSTIPMPAPGGSLLGAGWGTVLNYFGSGSCITISNAAGPYNYTRLGNEISGLIIDGTNAGAGAIGLNMNANQHDRFWLAIRNFTSGAAGGSKIGVRIANDQPGTALNQIYGSMRLDNNDNNVVFRCTNSDQAIEHIYMNFSIVTTNANQNGIVLQHDPAQGGINVQGSLLRVDIRSVYGTPGQANGAALVFGAGCFFTETTFQWKNELTAGSGTPPTTVLFDAGGASGFKDTAGILYFSSNLGLSNIAAVGATVHHWGIINEASILPFNQLPQENNVYSGTMTLGTVATPALPASGGSVTNNTGYAVLVNFIGGTLTGVTVGPSGSHTARGTAGVYVIPPGQGITPSWSVAPTGWNWQPIT